MIMNESEQTHILQTQLERYAAQDLYPFHMPGHKRRMSPAPGLPFAWDVTEVPGTDDLHDASGILLDAMQRSASLWGADRTWYLVNGSTCGLLAAIRALAKPGSEILCARNCHKAVFHAIELAGCRVRWIMPAVDEDWGICTGITADQVRKMLRKNPDVKALILTSPTYEGVLSDIRGISVLCHQKGIPLIVDEAHGAHLLPMSANSGFPDGALACGADLVIQSPHKTLPSLTQTAFLHLQGNLVDPEIIEEQLDIFETSSPSYPLLASLDGCTGIIREHGRELFESWKERLGRFDNAVMSLQKLRVFNRLTGAERNSGTKSPFIYDPGKILIDAAGAGVTGRELASFLREKKHIEIEMTQGSLVLAMTSLCDDENALDLLADALAEIDAQASEAIRSTSEINKMPVKRYSTKAPAAACTFAEAVIQEAEIVPLSGISGRICAEYLYFYPPGIPFLAPGEIITPENRELILEAEKSGEFTYRRKHPGCLLCLRE